MKTAVFIDGDYLYKMAHKKGKKVDYDELRELFEDTFDDGPKKYFYYQCTKNNGSDGYKGIIPLMDWLSYNSFIVRHRDITDTYFEEEHRAFIAMQMTADALLLADRVENMIFIIRHPEYSGLMELLRNKVHLTLIQSKILPAHQAVRRNVDVCKEIDDFVMDTLVLSDMNEVKVR